MVYLITVADKECWKGSNIIHTIKYEYFQKLSHFSKERYDAIDTLYCRKRQIKKIMLLLSSFDVDIGVLQQHASCKGQ